MTEATLQWRDYRYFPYEREFARLEVERTFNTSPREDGRGLHVPMSAFSPAEADRLTYFARIEGPNGIIVPRQTRLEATATSNRSERQSTRYSAHGLHEYKGKFNPQIVRAIGNIIGVEADATVLDPFCGSGTTLLECLHNGWNAVGFDINPLAVMIANAKIRSLYTKQGMLEAQARELTSALEVYTFLCVAAEDKPSEIAELLGWDWTSTIRGYDYLKEWFAAPVLAQAAIIIRAIEDTVRDDEDRNIFVTILSDQLRSVSLQDPGDLRIRRRKDPASNYPLLETYIDAVNVRVARIERAKAELGPVTTEQRAHLFDVSQSVSGVGITRPASVDAVISSPPYATALPYIDTQRLSLVLLGLLSSKELRSVEAKLIGARELTTVQRREAEERILAGDDQLPDSVEEFCRTLLLAAKGPGNGFRRRNQPALIHRYMSSMARFFNNLRPMLKDSARAAFVVGVNRTTLGGQEFIIDTPELLSRVAEHCGFVLIDERPMETYARYDLHQTNSIDVERLIVFTKQ